MQEVSHVFQQDTFSVTTLDICKQPLILDIGNDTLLCYQQSLLIKDNSEDGFDTYLWSTGATTTSITVNNSGIYHLRVIYNCNIDTLFDTIKVDFAPPIINNLGEDIIECENKSHLFSAPYCLNCNYLWSTGSINDTIMAFKPGNYWLQVSDTNGCIYSDTVSLDFAKCECEMFFPNSFTPNNDGLNEVFQPNYNCDLANYQLRVFNRKGQQIYSTKNSLAGWNGKINNINVLTGVYLYSVKYDPLIKGKIGKQLNKTGTVTVIY